MHRLFTLPDIATAMYLLALAGNHHDILPSSCSSSCCHVGKCRCIERMLAVCYALVGRQRHQRKGGRKGEFDCIDSNVKSASLVSYMFLRTIGMASAFGVDFFGREGVNMQNLKAQH